MNEKECQRMESNSYDDTIENDINELIDEIAKEYNHREYDLTTGEQEIVNKIIEILKRLKKDVKYDGEENPREVIFEELNAGKRLSINIRVDYDSVIYLMATYPFCSLESAIPVMCLKMAEINSAFDREVANLDLESGEIYLSIKLINNGAFDVDFFSDNLTYLIEVANKKYTLFHKLSAGMLAEPIFKNYYINLLEKTLKELKAEKGSLLFEENENLVYGAPKSKYLDTLVRKTYMQIDTLEIRKNMQELIDEEIPAPICVDTSIIEE